MITLELETKEDSGCVYVSDIHAIKIVDDRLYTGELDRMYEEMPEILANNEIEPKANSVYEIDIVRFDRKFLEDNPSHDIYKFISIRFIRTGEFVLG